MNEQKSPQGIPRKIVGFHRDEHEDWVAELACGHQQHVRHNPPWMNREWVTTVGGRQSRIGTELNCLACVTEALNPI
jgi:hypothetical protein